MKSGRSVISLFLCLLQVLLVMPRVYGFEVETHTLLSERAVQASGLNDFLTTVLPDEFPQGIGQVLRSGPFGNVQELVANVGAVNEDKPFTRSRHHFHDPTRLWNQAGLRWPVVGQVGNSSVLWGQHEDQGSGGKHSWKDARDSYFNALTATDPEERKGFFAETFESLGHLIHLVQDAAVPGHSRNDTHIGFFVGQGYGFPIGGPDRFHHWARFKGGPAIASAGSQPFNSSILELSQNPLAPIPIARIIDATDDDRGMPSGGDDIGIAEFSNGNFFSDDTILKDYSFPNISQLTQSPEPGPNGPALRNYLRKNSGPGPTGYRAAVASRLAAFLPAGFSNQQWELYDHVMKDYGDLLFPRAIGYSAGLIDYFFHGQVMALIGNGAFATATSYPIEFLGSDFISGFANPKQPAGTGVVVLVLLPKSATTGVTSRHVSQPQTVTIVPTINEGVPRVDLTMDFSSNPLPLPEWGDYDWDGYVVWRGPIAQLIGAHVTIVEQDGVLVSGDLSFWYD